MPKLKVDLIVDDKGSVVVRKFGSNVLDMAKGFVTGQIALDLLNRSLGLFRQEITTGLAAVEDYNLKIASMASFMATSSKKAAEGDFAGGFRDSLEYAKQLVPTLEALSARTAASGKDLKVMAETAAMYGVTIDVNNKKQVDGFLNISNALKLVTQGQNQDIQMRQEINALLTGQVRMTDRLPKLLQAQDPELKKHLELWRRQGTVWENVGKLLSGFKEGGDLISRTWTAIGSTMDTIHTRILRGGMKPVYKDLLRIAKDINKSLMDQDGNLTETGKTLQGVIAVAWLDIKNTVAIVWTFLKPFMPLLSLMAELIVKVADGWGMLLAVLKPIAEFIIEIGWAINKTIKSALYFVSGDFAAAKAAWAENGRLIGKAFGRNLGEEMTREYNAYLAAKNIGDKNNIKPAAAPEMAAQTGKYVERQIKALHKIANTDHVLLAGRLHDYQKFYADLNQQIEDNVKAQYDALKTISDLYRQQSELRRSTEGLLSGLGADGPTAIEQYTTTREELARQFELAKQLTGQDRISALENYKKAVAGLAREFKDGIFINKWRGSLPGKEIVDQAIADVSSAYDMQKQALSDLTDQARQQHSAAQIWGEELKTEAGNAVLAVIELQDTLAALDDQMTSMDKELDITARDQATRVIDNIKTQVDLLHDKTITITTVYQKIGGAGGAVDMTPPVLGSYAAGTGYIPETGPYLLHRGESVNTGAETSALSAGGGAFKVTSGGVRDVHIHLPEQAGALVEQDASYWRQVTRDYIIPEMEAVGRAG